MCKFEELLSVLERKGAIVAKRHDDEGPLSVCQELEHRHSEIPRMTFKRFRIKASENLKLIMPFVVFSYQFDDHVTILPITQTRLHDIVQYEEKEKSLTCLERHVLMSSRRTSGNGAEDKLWTAHLRGDRRSKVDAVSVQSKRVRRRPSRVWRD
jgi:hypothetical protein